MIMAHFLLRYTLVPDYLDRRITIATGISRSPGRLRSRAFWCSAARSAIRSRARC
jgi:hypothetical protein